MYAGGDPVNLVDPLGTFDVAAWRKSYINGLGGTWRGLRDAWGSGVSGVANDIRGDGSGPLSNGLAIGVEIFGNIPADAIGLGVGLAEGLTGYSSDLNDPCPTKLGMLERGLLVGGDLAALASLGAGATAGVAAKAAARGAKRAPALLDDAAEAFARGGGCFAAGTLVWTPDGPAAIEDVAVGDVVLAYNKETGEVEPRGVLQTFVRDEIEVLELAFADGTVVLATEEHPFLLEDGRWWAAGVLEPGEVVVQRAEGGGPGAARAIDSVSETGQRTRVFNLEVEGLHTYLVGDSAWVVHNAGCPPKPSPSFVVSPDGTAIPIPRGATGPEVVRSGKGFQFQGGSGGGYGLSDRVTGVRVMDATAPSGPSPGFPNGYVNYFNKVGQSVDPATGKTIAPSDPAWHIPIGR